jgi:hypothetical protein
MNATQKMPNLKRLAEGANAGWQAATGALDHHAAAIGTRCGAT